MAKKNEGLNHPTKEKRYITKSDIEFLMALFYESLAELSSKTIRNHLTNIDFFLSYFLYNYRNHANPLNIKRMKKEIDNYLGCYYIRKYLSSSPSGIRSNAASIKKFYKCLLEHDMIQEEEYEQLCEVINQGLPEWVDIYEEYCTKGWSYSWICS